MKLAVLVSLLFLIAAIPPASGQSVSTSSASTQQVGPSVLSYNKTASPPSFGEDTGIEHYSYSAKGFTMTVPGGGSFTLGLPTIVFASAIQKVVPTITFSKNSSEYTIQAVGATTKQSSLFFIHFKNSTSYNQKAVWITGISSQAATISFVLTYKGTPAICDSASHKDALGSTVPPCTRACFSGACFDWSDAATYNPSYNNATQTVSFNVSTLFTIDPIALDGSNTNGCGSAGSCTVTLTTTSSPDVIILDVTVFSCTVSISGTPTDTSSLHWNARVGPICNSGGGGQQSWEYYAKANATLTGDTITVNISPNGYETLLVYGASGAKVSGGSPFDPHLTSPVTNTGTSTNVTVSGVTTTNANDMLTLYYGDRSTGTESATAGYGFTIITSGSSAGSASVNRAAEYRVVSATITGKTFSLTVTQAYGWSAIADAICSASGCGASTVTQPITITTLTSGAPSGTITISGCSASNGTFTADGYQHTYSSMTASCSITLTTSGVSGSTRYEWDVSPKPTASTTLTFSTCSSGTCSTYSNSTYYQLANTYEATAQTPTTWDGNYGVPVAATFLGVSESNLNNFLGGGTANTQVGDTTDTVCPHSVASCWADYDTAVSLPAMIGNTWTAQAPTSFMDTTGGNTHAVDYIQSSGGGGISAQQVFGIFVLVGITASFMLVVTMIARKR
jgi:hypothetical protein